MFSNDSPELLEAIGKVQNETNSFVLFCAVRGIDLSSTLVDFASGIKSETMTQFRSHEMRLAFEQINAIVEGLSKSDAIEVVNAVRRIL